MERMSRRASLRWFLTICEEIVWFCKPIVVAAVQVAGADDRVGEDAGRGGPGLVWVHKGSEASWMYWTFNLTTAPTSVAVSCDKTADFSSFCCGQAETHL